MKTIKTSTRNVKQSVRKFTDDQRKEIISLIDNRPSNITKSEMFRKFGMGAGNLYYLWKEKFGIKMNSPMNSPMNVKSTKIIYGKQNTHTVVLSVEVGSLLELIRFCNDIVKTPKVKSVLSVE